MQISKETIGYLKSFSGINPSIWVEEGNVLRTMSPHKTMVASATVTEEFPMQFGIYDLNSFLGVLSLLKDPDVDFKPNYVNIVSGASKVRYAYVAKNVIVTPPEKELSLPDEAVSFVLTNENLDKVMRGAGVLGSENIVVEGAGGELSIMATNADDKDSNEYKIILGDHKEDDVRFTFRTENLKIMPADYEVAISSQGISQFVGKESASYFITTEK